MPGKTKVKLDSKIRIAAVSYLNTKPLLYGIEQSPLLKEIELKTGYPAEIAQWLLSDETDLALVPVAVIPQLKQSYIVSDYCIGCDGEVGTVCLFSDVPVEEITQVLLDYQSQTSNELVKILLHQHWKINPEIIYSDGEYRHLIKNGTAAVVIGDRAFEQKRISKYYYDLGAAWKAMTGLPFVFAAWVSNKKLPDDFIAVFNEANAYGVNHIAEVIITINNSWAIDLDEYFTSNIGYLFDDSKKKALEKFFQLCPGFNPEPLFHRV